MRYMIDTIMFDLDGTLIQYSQESFIGTYFPELKKVFIKLGLDPDVSISAVLAGIKAMVLNDGSVLNTHTFWQTFAESMRISSEMLALVEAACDSFYTSDFGKVRTIVKQNDISKQLVRKMAEKGYTVVLATNPMFPLCAVETRLGWIGLELNDFELVTYYANSSFCKPNPDYFHEVLMKIGKTPEQCFMAGNHPVEDMAAQKLGIEVFLVTDFLENDSGTDISAFRKGSLAELEAYLAAFPDILPEK